MNGAQIANFFSLDPCTGGIFKGLAMSDSPGLFDIEHDRAMYVLNTGTTAGKGVHWCLVYFDEHEGEFFDPIGLPPSSYGGFARLLRWRGEMTELKNTQRCVQNPFGIACGAHCLFYGFHRCRGWSMAAILSLYDQNDLVKNDQMVVDFVTGFGKNYEFKFKKFSVAF
jgi:hypothetical protein